MQIWFYLILFLFSLGQIGRISFAGQEANVYLYEIFYGLIIGFLVWKYKLNPLKRLFAKYRIVWLFVGWLLITYILAFGAYTTKQNFIAFLYLFRLSFYILSFFYLVWLISKNPQFKQKITFGLVILSSLIVAVGFSQYFLYPDLRNLFYLGWDPHLYRTFGLFFDTSTAAAVYGIFLLFWLIKSSEINLSKYVKLFLILAFILLGLLTYSRGFYLAILLTLTVYLFFRRQYIYIFLVAVIFITSLSVLPKRFGEGVNLLRTFSITSRQREDKIAIAIWQKKPLFGIGYNHIRYEKEKLGYLNDQNIEITHSGASFPSSFLIILVTSGVIGLTLFVFWLWRLAEISQFSLLLIIFISLFSLTDNILLHPFVLFLLIVLLSLEKRVLNYRRSN